jgi:hypothetical protein
LPGRNGRSATRYFSLPRRVDIQVGTLSKPSECWAATSAVTANAYPRAELDQALEAFKRAGSSLGLA